MRRCVYSDGMGWLEAAECVMEQLVVESPEPPRRRRYHYHDYFYEEDYLARGYSDDDSFNDMDDDF